MRGPAESTITFMTTDKVILERIAETFCSVSLKTAGRFIGKLRPTAHRSKIYVYYNGDALLPFFYCIGRQRG